MAYEKQFGDGSYEEEMDTYDGDLPPWLILPPDWDDMNKIQKTTFVEKAVTHRTACEKIVKNNETQIK